MLCRPFHTQLRALLLLALALFTAQPLEASQKLDRTRLTDACDLVLGISPVLSVELSGGAPTAFQKYFSDLPLDQYLVSKGNFFRRRRYSRFHVDAERVVQLSQKAFTQSAEVNPLFADVPRTFEPLDPSLIVAPEFAQLVRRFLDALPGTSSLYEIGVHQIRVLVDPLQDIVEAQPVPEGRHKDGVDFIGIYVVDRKNVKGAATLLSTTQDGEPLYQSTLAPGQLLVVNDRELWHYATAIQSIDGGVASRDVFIFTAEEI